MEFQLTDEQIATLLEGYQAMNGDTDTKSIVSDLGIQDYVSVSGNEVTSKPVETQTSGSGANTQTAPTTTSSPTTTTTTNDFGIPEINYTGGGNDTGKVDIDLSKVGGGDTPSEPSKPSKPSEPTPGSGPKGSEPSEPTKPTTTTDPTPAPTTTETPTTTTTPTPTTTTETNLPQTGDASDYLIFAIVAVCIVVAIVAYKKVREYNNI